MPRSARNVPKEIAAFGERQFKETGAVAVEVLRVKAAVMRKHFRQLKGITFIVAVVSLDRVRIYFFNAAGVMLVGENVEESIFKKIRKDSKLIVRFEKPKELTPEEQRIEATQEFRDSLAKAIRRVTRFLSLAAPVFPDIFVTKTSSDVQKQSFGLQISDDNEYIFEESALKTKWADGLITRSAFLAHLDITSSQSTIASLIGNGIAVALLKEPEKKAFRETWQKNTKDSEWLPLVNHLIKHTECYMNEGFSRIHQLLQQLSSSIPSQLDKWILPLKVIHDEVRVSIGTEEYHVISRFCKTLSKPRKLNSRKDVLDSIHLGPRVICDPSPLDMKISISYDGPSEEDWATVSYLDRSDSKTLSVGPKDGSPITGINYWLNLEDVYPTSGGLLSHGKSVLERAKAALGFSSKTAGTFEALMEFSEMTLSAKEKAVLERLILGQLDILSDTLIGSPQIVDSLYSKEKVIFLPSFNHIGVNSDYLLKGKVDAVRSVARGSCLEATIFETNGDAVSVVSAPSTWKSLLLDSIVEERVSLWPILSSSSKRNILRSEDLFPERKLMSWN